MIIPDFTASCTEPETAASKGLSLLHLLLLAAVSTVVALGAWALLNRTTLE